MQNCFVLLTQSILNPLNTELNPISHLLALLGAHTILHISRIKVNVLEYKYKFNPLNSELNPICCLLALLAPHFLHVSRITVKSLPLRLLMSYIYICMYIHTWSTYSLFLDHTQRRSTVGMTPLDE